VPDFVVGVLGLVIGLVQTAFALIDRRSTRNPLVVVSEDESPPAGPGVPGGVKVHIDVEGAQATNIRFGVEMDGVRAMFHNDPAAYRHGRTERIMRPGERYPVTGSASIAIPWWMARGGEARFRSRNYVATYEDERGRQWETRNPAFEGGHFIGPQRIRAAWLRDWQHTVRRSEMKMQAERSTD
jgi:hypothetical protein